MGKFRLEIEDFVNEDISKIYKSGDKATIKKLEKILLEFFEHQSFGTRNPEQLKLNLSGFWSRPHNE